MAGAAFEFFAGSEIVEIQLYFREFSTIKKTGHTKPKQKTKRKTKTQGASGITSVKLNAAATHQSRRVSANSDAAPHFLSNLCLF